MARTVASALWEAILAGMEEITHFEEIGILREGIGADRISDATAGILRHRLAAYTAEICQRHGIPVQPARYLRGRYDLTEERWFPISTQLPFNPFNGKPILLVPLYYLRELPTINPMGFWEYCVHNENETIRDEFNYDVSSRVSKKDIIDLANRHPEMRKSYIEDVEQQSGKSYDFERDRHGYVQWYPASKAYCYKHPLTLQIASDADFFAAVEQMVSQYKHYVEENNGWHLLWNDDATSKGEKSAQYLLLGIVKNYCVANNIDVSPEVNIGRGPVDFKVSRGYRLRSLLEVKLARNTKFWNGLTKQLPAYLNAEQVSYGYFVVVALTDEDFKRITTINEVVADVNRATGYDIRVVVIDARYGRLSASKL